MTAKRARKRSVKRSAPKIEVGVLIPQPGGGALSPGNPGNRGGGRPKDIFREKCREAFNRIDGLKIVEDIATGTLDDVKPQDRQRALEFLKNNGWGQAPLVVELEQEQQGSRFRTGEEAMKWLLETTGRLLRVLAPDPEARAELLDAMVNDRDPMKRLAAKEMIQRAEETDP